MNRKWLPYIVILGLAILLFIARRCNQVNAPAVTNPGQSKAENSPAKTKKLVNRNHGFDRRISYLEYTRHAKCRMGCRHITQEEVEAVMQGGVLNYAKSSVKAKPCPEYAVEGKTADGQRVRIVFAQCDTRTKVVTTIDLDNDWTCDCPGDNKKSMN